MTRDEFEFHMEHNCFSHAAKDLRAHDQSQREENARLREALNSIVRIRFLLGNDPRLNPAYEMGNIAQSALAKEVTHDNTE